MEGDVALIRPIFALVKGMLEVQAKQQFLIESLGRSYSGMLAALCGDGQPAEAQPRSAAQAAAIAKAKAEVAELERMFSGEPKLAEGEMS